MTEASSSASNSPSWPIQHSYRQDLFRGTAEFYSQYRPAYPDAMFADLIRRAGDGGRLIDLACGTGEIAIPLASRFAGVQAVDLEPDMVEVGRQKAAAAGVRNIEWSIGKADLAVAAPVDLVTIGNAFHRLDRPLIAERARGWLSPGGCSAVLGSSTPWSGSQPWQHVAVDVVAHWAGGPGSPASSSAAPVGGRARRTHEDVLCDTGFVEVTEYQFPTQHTWTVDEFLGFLWSTSYTAPLRENPSRAAEFEKDMRTKLSGFAPSGQLRETIAHYYILARNP
ncbi:methyltransferase domain-containing protein [Nocardia sp. NPDC050435]|uniref:class I SAM-dependent methyltransferase n=1 Tax=Nocardia sp. NPDC050435 TaxID=3155040 RepID=UPI0033CDF48A